ncbi:MAG: leucine-rich repeat domain-containing protein [Bacteroidota bacterium]
MKIKILFILLLVFFEIHNSCAQNTKNIKCFNFDEAQESPDSITCLSIDFTFDSIKLVVSKINQFKNLTRIEIQDMSKCDLPILNQLKNISSLTISNSEEISITEIVNGIKNDSSLVELILDANEIKQIPKCFENLSFLQRVIITNNEELDLYDAVSVFSKMSNLKYLGLPINEIMDLPKNIGKLNQVEVLDISNNYLLGLPSGMKNMNKLDTLYTEGNVFVSPSDDLNKLKSLNIKYISVDESTDSEALDKLYEIFPNSKIEIKKEKEQTAKLPQVLPDSAVFSIKNELKDSTESPNIDYGQFKMENTNVFIYSDAYARYASFYERDRVPATFDTLLFDQRFESLNYTNNFRTQPNINSGIRLLKLRRTKKNIYFTFCYNPDMYYIAKSYKELTAYITVKWVYKGSLKKREFRRKYLTTRYRSKYWRDVKIEASEDFKDFQIILKGEKKFDTIVCYPFLSSSPEEDAGSVKLQKALLKRYFKYMNLRTKRANYNNSMILGSYKLYKDAIEKTRNAKWISFQKLYMSPIEQKMTYKEWMEYYDKIMQDEGSAVKNSELTMGTTIRALEVNNYVKTSSSSLINDTIQLVSLSTKFSSDNKKVLSIKTITIIDKTTNSYYTLDGTMGNKPVALILPKNNELGIVLESLIGEIAVIDNAEIQSKMNFNETVSLKATMLNSKIGTVSQIFNMLNL